MKTYPVNRMSKTFLVSDISRQTLEDLGYDARKISNERMGQIADYVANNIDISYLVDTICTHLGIKVKGE